MKGNKRDLIEKGLKSAAWYIFTDVFGYQPLVLFLVVVGFLKEPSLEIISILNFSSFSNDLV
jgi:hypothetical protein